MPLQPGDRLAAYEIVAALGAGGMGEVYRARDTKLGREVAIKVLPQELATDERRLARLEREAKALAALNHPNVATLYGFETAGQTHFLVMELVEGEDLAARIRKRSIAVVDAIALLTQIAEGLEAAHGKGIVHRDLKPANLMVTEDGKVKILDFGLAKAMEYELPDDISTQSPTMTAVATRAGVLMGTAAYMSPEQARGKGVDERTDIFAFGAVGFEILSGTRAFRGEDLSETLASVLRDEPSWQALSRSVPIRLSALLQRCLRKEKRRRYQDIGDVRVELEDLAAAGDAAVIASPAPKSALPVWMAPALVAALAVAAWSFMREPVRPSIAITRSTIELDDPLAQLTNMRPFVISPDGSRLVAVVEVDGTTQLWLRELSELEGRLIPGTEGAVGPFFAPDGQSIGFIGGDSWLKSLSLSGGAQVDRMRVPPVSRGVAWASETEIVLNGSLNSGLLLLSGSEVGSLTEAEAEQGVGSHRWPSVIPGTRDVLFTMHQGGSYDEARIASISLDTGVLKVLLEGGSDARSTLSGHLVFRRADSLLAVPFDTSTLAVRGNPKAVVPGVRSTNHGLGYYDVSHTGTLVYAEGDNWDPRNALVWVDQQGNVESIWEEETPIWDVALSPDGRHVAYTVATGSNSDIWTFDLERGAATKLTTDSGEDFNPVWSPDGEWIAFASEMSGAPPQVHLMRRDGSEVRLLVEEWPADAVHAQRGSGTADIPLSWSSDGRFLAVGGSDDVLILPLEEPNRPRPALATAFKEHGASLSPNGEWMAYHSDESGRNQVYVQPFPGPGQKKPVSSGSGSWPHWSESGTTLFYRDGNRVFAVGVEYGADLELSPPRLLFEGRFGYGIGHSNYDLSSDGRFLMVQMEEPPAKKRLVLVTHWLDELERLVPSD